MTKTILFSMTRQHHLQDDSLADMELDSEEKPLARASRDQAEAAWQTIMRAPDSSAIESSEDRELWRVLLASDAQTVSFLSIFVPKNPDISAAWIAGVLTDGMPGQVVRDFCMTLRMLGESAAPFDRDEILSIGRGLRCHLPAGTELSQMGEEATEYVSALAALTAAVWLHAPESQEHGVIDNTVTGIHLADRRLADLMLSEPGKLNQCIAFIREFETSRYEDIARHLALSPALLDGEL